VLAFAPRIPQTLVAYLAVIDDPAVPIAELNRRVGRKAAAIGVPRPSYERIRQLVHDLRRRRLRQALAAWARLQLALRTRRFEAVLHLSGSAGLRLGRRPSGLARAVRGP
jgi:hypothetical protein